VRKDGFHELVTVYHAVSMYDEVVVAQSDRLTVTVVGEGAADVPTGADNLASLAFCLAAVQSAEANGAPVSLQH